jgi:hypothetical protein
VNKHLHICSLPALYATSLDAVSGAAYIAPPHDQISKAKQILGGSGDKFKVGIVWSGSTTFKTNSDRAVLVFPH